MGDGINDGLELAKKCIEQVFEPFKDVLHSLLSPTATQVGLSFGDQAAFWRSKRLLRFREAFYQYALDHGLQVKPVSPRLLFPICENACLEDDEDLYTRWIALLANAATERDVEVLPCFPDILKQLTAEEAKFLDRAYDETTIGAEKRHAEIRANNPQFSVNDELVTAIGISGRIRTELIEAAMDTTLIRERRALALDLIEEIDRSQVDDYQPKAPADGWLGEELLPLQTQVEISLRVTLGNRWAQGKPKSISEFIPQKSQSSISQGVVTTPVNDFEDEFDVF